MKFYTVEQVIEYLSGTRSLYILRINRGDLPSVLALDCWKEINHQSLQLTDHKDNIWRIRFAEEKEHFSPSIKNNISDYAMSISSLQLQGVLCLFCRMDIIDIGMSLARTRFHSKLGDGGRFEKYQIVYVDNFFGRDDLCVDYVTTGYLDEEEE